MRPIKVIEARVTDLVPYPAPLPPNYRPPSPGATEAVPLASSPRKPNLVKELIAFAGLGVLIFGVFLNLLPVDQVRQWLHLESAKKWYVGQWMATHVQLTFYSNTRGVGKTPSGETTIPQDLLGIEQQGDRVLFTVADSPGPQARPARQYVLKRVNHNMAKLYQLNSGRWYSLYPSVEDTQRGTSQLGEENEHTFINTFVRQ